MSTKAYVSLKEAKNLPSAHAATKKAQKEMQVRLEEVYSSLRRTVVQEVLLGDILGVFTEFPETSIVVLKAISRYNDEGYSKRVKLYGFKEGYDVGLKSTKSFYDEYEKGPKGKGTNYSEYPSYANPAEKYYESPEEISCDEEIATILAGAGDNENERIVCIARRLANDEIEVEIA